MGDDIDSGGFRWAKTTAGILVPCRRGVGPCTHRIGWRVRFCRTSGTSTITSGRLRREFLEWSERRAGRPLEEWKKRVWVAQARMIGDLLIRVEVQRARALGVTSSYGQMFSGRYRGSVCPLPNQPDLPENGRSRENMRRRGAR
jgi:hypothetical protein